MEVTQNNHIGVQIIDGGLLSPEVNTTSGTTQITHLSTAPTMDPTTQPTTEASSVTGGSQASLSSSASSSESVRSNSIDTKMENLSENSASKGELFGEKSNIKANPFLYRCTLAACGKVEYGSVKFKQCAKCGVRYCCRDCQLIDWKILHKTTCALIVTQKADSSSTSSYSNFKVGDRSALIKVFISNSIFYLSSFAAINYRTKGRGIVLAQSSLSLLDFFQYFIQNKQSPSASTSTSTSPPLLNLTYYSINRFKRYLTKCEDKTPDKKGNGRVSVSNLGRDLKNLIISYSQTYQVKTQLVVAANLSEDWFASPVTLCPEYDEALRFGQEYDGRDSLLVDLSDEQQGQIDT